MSSKRGTIVQGIKRRKVLVSDGAWGTMMQLRGLSGGECPELWNTSDPETVTGIAQAYVDAGSDIIETNSFGGTVYKLAHFGLEGKVEELNRLAAELSRKAAGEERWVIGSMGPTGKMTAMGDVTVDDFYRVFAEQAKALEAGGVDALMIETMSAVDEACAAVKAGRENTSREIIASFTFEPTVQGEYRTMMGVSPAEAAKAAADAGADIIGANCGRGYAGMERVVAELKEAVPELPVLIQTNAGIPKQVDGVSVFPATPEEMGNQVKSWIDAGASIIGGCCGTTEKHIAAIKKAVDAVIGS